MAIDKSVLGLILFILVAVGGAFLLTDSFSEQSVLTLSDGSEVQLALPIMGAYSCESKGAQKIGLTTNIEIPNPDGGQLLYKENVGFFTNGVTNLKFTVTQTNFWQFIVSNVRIRYEICDEYGNFCGSDKYIKFDQWGTATSVPEQDLDFRYESIRFWFEKSTLFGWRPIESGATGKLTYNAYAWALYDISPVTNPAGNVVCETSCDLTCPDIGVRENIIYNCGGNPECQDKGIERATTLDFGDSAPYLISWVKIIYDLDQQGGVKVYDEATNKFCFGGQIYNGATFITMTGDKIIYPNERTKVTLECCPNARISSTNSDLVCNAQGKWEVIEDSTKLTCISAFDCPNAGNTICRDRTLSSGYRCLNQDDNNVGVCVYGGTTPVECCSDSDCARDQQCDNNYNCAGGSTEPTCGNRILEPPEQCDDGNLRSGDGCSASCQNEVEPVCGDRIVQGGEQCDDGNTQNGDGCSSTCQDETQGGISDIAYILIIIATGIIGIVAVMYYMPDKKTGLWVALGLLIATIVAMIVVMSQLGITTDDLTLRILACGGEKEWWENIPIIGLFGCNGRLDQVIGIIGAVALTVFLYTLIPQVFMAVPWLALVPAIIGYLLSIYVGDFVLDRWYIIALALAVVYAIRTAILDK